MKQTLLTLVALLLLGSTLMAQEPHYVAGEGYDRNMVYCAVARLDGEFLVYDSQVTMEVGYFAVIGGTEVTLGSDFMIAPDPRFGYDYYFLNGTIPFPSDGLTVTFKLYNHSTGKEYTICPNTVQTLMNAQIGDAINYEILDFHSPIGKDIIGYGGDSPDAPAGHFYLIASPIGEVSPVDVTNMLNDAGYDLFYFDQSQSLEWVNYKSGTDPGFNLQPGTGYLYANHESVTLQFNGVAYTGTGEVALTRVEAAAFKGWNLVGNPFADIAYIDRPFYKMNSNGTGIMTQSSTGGIEAMEGVFVMATEDGETMTFTTTPPTKGSMIALNLNQGRGTIDRAIVSFSESHQLPKFQLFENSTKIYIPQGNQDYAVVCSEGQGELPVNFRAAENGTYTLSMDVENMEVNYLHLIDNKTGADVDLLATPSYSFEAKKTDYPTRFKLVFSTGQAADDNFAFFSNGSWIINNDGQAILQVVDLNGRILSNEQISGSCSKSIKAAAGVYMLRLINGDNVKVQKIVVE